MVDGRLAADAEARAREHLSACPDCAGAVDSERLVKARLQTLAEPQLSQDLLVRLLDIGGPSGPLPPRDAPMAVPARPVVGTAPPSRTDPVRAPLRGAVRRPAGRRARRRPVAAATVVAGPDALRGRTLLVHPGGRSGTLGSARLDDAVTDDARGLLETGTTACLHLGADGQRRHDELEVFVESFAPPPRMIVFGAIDFAAALARVGAFLGFHVTVCDARPVFATARRFPDADEVVVEWPHRYLARTEVDERTVLCVLTHDPRFDVPLLEVALRGPAAYVGAMGSRRTHEDRLARLRESGLDEAQLARLSSPIGLDLGARTPEETAVSIAAEITAARWGGSGEPLRRTAGRIHHEGAGGGGARRR
nr:XdhC/CoxI family protein [Kineococcus vitellinus]